MSDLCEEIMVIFLELQKVFHMSKIINDIICKVVACTLHILESTK